MASPIPDPYSKDETSAAEEPAATRSSPRRLPGWLASGTIHDWVKTITVVVAAGWGIYTFIYKDILLPSRAPASLVVEVKSLAKQGPGSSKSGGGEKDSRRDLKLRISATNPTQRPLFLLPSVWWMWALERKHAAPEAFEKAATDALHHGGLQHAERGTQIQGSPILATGTLFTDNRIQPGEKITRDLPIGLSGDTGSTGMNQLELVMLVPVLTRDPGNAQARRKLFDGRGLGWSYSDQADVHPVLCGSLNGCQIVDQQKLSREVSEFDPDALIFSKSVVVGGQQ